MKDVADMMLGFLTENPDVKIYFIDSENYKKNYNNDVLADNNSIK